VGSSFTRRLTTFRASSTCSTPFGIIGIFTNRSQCPHPNLTLCSTPFGIIGIFTPARRCASTREQDVLNAFRHHWNLHPALSASPLDSLRVLNAFRHHWNLHAEALRPSSCRSSAQRLSASLESSLALEMRRFNPESVCSTPFGIIGIFTGAGLIADYLSE
jgi:hypothetical protein